MSTRDLAAPLGPGLAAALAATDPDHEPLAAALEDSVRAAQSFELAESGTALVRAQDFCRG